MSNAGNISVSSLARSTSFNHYLSSLILTYKSARVQSPKHVLMGKNNVMWHKSSLGLYTFSYVNGFFVPERVVTSLLSGKHSL